MKRSQAVAKKTVTKKKVIAKKVTAKKRKSDPRKAPAVEIPHDDFNEQILIAAALNDPAAARIILKRCKPTLFMGEGHDAIIEAIGQAHQRGLTCDGSTIRQLGGERIRKQYVDDLMRQHKSAPTNLGHHIATLEWDTARAKLVEGPLSELLEKLEDPTVDPERVLAIARQIPQSLTGYGDRQYMYDPDQLVRENEAEMRARMSGVACYSYGIPDLDRHEETGEWRVVPGSKLKQITLVTAVSGSGKSTVLARMALHFAEEKRRVLFGAWEMQSGLSLEMLATFKLGWSRTKMAVGNFTEEELAIHLKAQREISAYVRFWKFPWGRDMGARPKYNDEVIDKIHAYIADSGAEICIFDLLRRAFVDRRLDSEEAALERMQVVADETCTHHIYAQQQRLKDIEKRNTKHPTREGIKGTSVWVDVPDTIIGVHLPSLWKNVPNTTLELLLLKQRHGVWPQRIEFDWDPDLAELYNGRTVDASVTEDEMKEWLKGAA